MKNKLLCSLLLSGLTLGSLPVLAQSGAGPLQPPGAPAPTMRTLDDIGEAADAAVDPRTPIAAADLPLTIDQPGSYYFAEDIEFSGSGRAITIESSNVTLDLMGFALRSRPWVSGDGIWIAQELENIAIRNGHIAGNTVVSVDAGTWTANEEGFRYGIYFSGNDTTTAQSIGLERLHVSGGRSGGIRIRGSAAIESCVAFSNGGNGIEAGYSLGGTVSNSVSRRNTGFGIVALQGTVSDSVAHENGESGIWANSGSVSGSVANENGRTGISTIAGSVTNCLAESNMGAGISGNTSNSWARFNGGRGISGSNVSYSTAIGNGGDGIYVARGNVSHSRSRSNDGDGIRVVFSGVVAFCEASNNDGDQIYAPQATRTGNYPSD